MLYNPFPDGKICRDCKQWKAIPALANNRHCPLGVDSWCKLCKAIWYKKRDRQRYLKNPAKETAQQKQWRDKNPDKVKQASKRYYDKHQKECQRNSQEWRKRNFDKAAKQRRSWARRNPDKIRAATVRRRSRKQQVASGFTPTEWDLCLNYWDNRCAICSRQQGLWHTLAQDHWIPLSKNGPYTSGNIIPLCHGFDGCNNSKKDRDPITWLTEKFGRRKANQIKHKIDDYFMWITSTQSQCTVKRHAAASSSVNSK